MERGIFKSVTPYGSSASSQRATPCGELSPLQLICSTPKYKAIENWDFIFVSFGFR